MIGLLELCFVNFLDFLSFEFDWRSEVMGVCVVAEGSEGFV